MEPPTVDRSLPTPTPIAPAQVRALGDVDVLDVRDEPAFAAGHLEGSGHVPEEELSDRRAELPPRHRRVLVVGAGPEQARRTAARIALLRYAGVWWLDGPLDALESGLGSQAPAARLWRPAPFLESVLPLLPPGRAADLAAGAGREAVALALRGFEVEAWDKDADALRRAQDLARRHGVTVRAVEADLEADDPGLPDGAYQTIVCFRFLHRPLFAHIARALAPGGMLVYETFRRGQERFGKPKRPRFLLEPGELLQAFGGLEILRHEEPSPPSGPLTSRILARRPRAH